MPKIEQITCHKAVNSRGDWTIETHVHLDDGSVGVETIPDGASKGQNEAVYIPVEKAIDIVSSVLNEALQGEDPFNQGGIDGMICALDGTKNKAHIGANSILSVSLAVAKASAVSKDEELYVYLGKLYGKVKSFGKSTKLPTPVFNILNGGKHAKNNLSFQEFMIIPAKHYNFERAYEIGVDIYHILQRRLAKDGKATSVGDEGGFAPDGFTVEQALNYIRDAANTKYKVGEDVFLGMDVAADSFRNKQRYNIKEQNLDLSQEELHAFYEHLLKSFEIIYLEDPFYETHHDAWANFYKDLQDKVMLVADDLVVTNPRLLDLAIKRKLANAVIVKPNQVGTLTETFEFIQIAQKNNMSVIVSHRSGETAENTFIADLSVAVGAEFIKSGAPARGERVVKYNRLLEIYYALSS